MRSMLLTTLLTALIAAPVTSGDETAGSASNAGEDLIPQHERDIALQQAVEGPTDTSGIESAVLGSIALDGEFEGLEGYVLRAREVTLAPGGQVAVHRHDSRPGVAYVLQGEAVEYRQGQDPAIHRVGSTAFEDSDVTHWWRNESDSPARVLVVDIVHADTP